MRILQNDIVPIEKELTISQIKQLISKLLDKNQEYINEAVARMDYDFALQLATERTNLTFMLDFLDTIDDVKLFLGKNPLM